MLSLALQQPVSRGTRAVLKTASAAELLLSLLVCCRLMAPLCLRWASYADGLSTATATISFGTAGGICSRNSSTEVQCSSSSRC
jgi:hypothetical protein